MNMQAIQIMILLLDGFIKLAPWRIVTAAMDRIGHVASESIARSLGAVTAACAGLCALPGASNLTIGSPSLCHILSGFYLGVMAWGCLRLRDYKWRISLPLPGRSASWKSGTRGSLMLEIMVIMAVVLAIVIAVVLVLASTKPGTFRVQRDALMKAPPERIFPLISSFHQWRDWSPWENRDPDLKRSYDGAGSGKGAVYAWEGNKKVGSGRMEILETSLPSKIVIKLDFFKPFEGHNIAEFTMLPQNGGAAPTTSVSWVMHGPAPFMHRVMQVFMNLDKMIGKDFEAGLASLKSLAEK